MATAVEVRDIEKSCNELVHTCFVRDLTYDPFVQVDNVDVEKILKELEMDLGREFRGFLVLCSRFFVALSLVCGGRYEIIHVSIS